MSKRRLRLALPYSCNASAKLWTSRDAEAWWEDRPQLVTVWSVIALEQALK